MKKIKHRAKITPPGGPIDKMGYNRKRHKKETRKEVTDFERYYRHN